MDAEEEEEKGGNREEIWGNMREIDKRDWGKIAG